MKCISRFALILLIAMTFNSNAIGLIVIANTDIVNIKVKKRQVRDIFMGNNAKLLLTPCALAPNSEARLIFNTKIVGLTESRIQSYWAQMRFSGRKKPPKEFASVDSVLAFVKNNKDTVAYVPSGTEIPEGLTIIYRTD